ncbi:response regulator [Croceivirga radicis]|uniref:Response regulator n=1 Tax=Croceivirga radicis TaxID=1929488 RepID=A0A1V6LN00_9FLAO|nr:response regulator [Croceivirga radicis]OQD41565.1 response regulator [Croceivirga radicis]
MRKGLIACIIDDDTIYQFTMKAILTKMACFKEIYIFNDGEEAIDYLSSHAQEPEKIPDLVLLDIDMPVLDGFQFMEQYEILLPQLKKTATIYMSSSSLDPKDIVKANKIENIKEYLIKPIEESKLAAMVRQIENTVK